MRASDRRRATFRRTHQLGETEDQFQERIRKDLEAVTGLSVAILKAGVTAPYVVKGFTPRGLRHNEPLIRVAKQQLLSAVNAFEAAAEKLRSAEAKPAEFAKGRGAS